MNKYINLKYKHKGRDFNGVDCYGLFHLIFREERGIILPDFTDVLYEINWQNKNENHILENVWDSWEVINKPYKRYDGLIFFNRNMKIASHIGMCIDDYRFIHISSEFSSRIDKIEPQWSRLLYKAMRYKNA